MTNTQTITRTNHYFRILVALAVLATLASLLVGSATRTAHASATFVVNSVGDQADADTGDGKCATPNGSCTLRAAISQANATPGADVINFNIGDSSAVKTIAPTSALPQITGRVTIDGYTQGAATSDPSDDAKPNTLAKGTNAVLKVQLNGTNVPAGSSGLKIRTGGSGTVIKGLVINRFPGAGVDADASNQNSIEGNFIGTDPNGTVDLGNANSGVRIHPDNDAITGNNVGGNSPAARNLISGNGGAGVELSCLSAPFNGTATFNRVQGNLIGTQKDGTTALGNSFAGVVIDCASANTVSGNTIAFNGSDGVQILDFVDLATGHIDRATGNGLFGNSMFSNAGLGIDLGDDGVTPNDAGDGDPAPDKPGPNNLQNFPVLTSAKTVSGTTTISAKLNSTPNRTFIVQFFSNPSGNEGQKFVGQTGVTTDAGGNASFTFSPATAVAAGQTVTATAILSETNNFNTSEFSAPRTVTSS